MNFYDQQSSKRRQSTLLLFAFVVVLVIMGGLIQGVITAFSQALGQGGSMLNPSKPALAMIALVWITMICGSLFRMLDVRAGGAVLARRFGAVHASDRTRHDKERQLLNVVAEVSIASTTAQPDVFVLRNDRSINAFVLGNTASTPAIVVTEGALDVFDREQLQAVVAHEFGHIANADLPLNMRLLVTMGGLVAIDEVGRLLIGRSGTDSMHPGKIVGYLLCALGAIGVISGRLICASFSRQREYLADATGVQFTRNPFALASALDVIREHDDRTTLRGVHSLELAHLCFQSGSAKRWLNKLLASHPAIALRIKAIEPHFDVKKGKYAAQSENTQWREHVARPPDLSFSNIHLQPVIIDASSNNAANADRVGQSPVVLSDRIFLLLTNETVCLAALFALFASDEKKQRQGFMNALGFSFDEKFPEEVRKVMQMMPDELVNDQMGIILQASTVLNKKLSIGQRQKVTLKLEQLLSVNGDYPLMDYAKAQLIRRKLNVEFPLMTSLADQGAGSAHARKAKNFDAMGREFALLLSLMVESSGASPAELDEQFARVLKCYTRESFPRRTGNETGLVKELEDAFQTLYVQPKTIRHAFVQHCVEIMQHDGIILPTERALLDLFAASLGCDELIAA